MAPLGCGKTATLFEAGRIDFITYFVIPRPISLDVSYSPDIKQMFLVIEQLVAKTHVVREFSSIEEATNALRTLKRLEADVFHCIKTLLVSRRISWSILRLQFGSRLTPLAWLYCQELEDFGNFFQTIFEHVSSLVKDNPPLLNTFAGVAAQDFRQVTTQRYVVALDECHRLTRYYRNAFLPRSIDFLCSDGTLTQAGKQFASENSHMQNPFDGSANPPSPFVCESSKAYKSIFPLLVESFLTGGAQTLVMLGTNLELKNLTELDSMVAKYSESMRVEEITEFHTFTMDDVLLMLRMCLNCKGLKRNDLSEIARDMEGMKSFVCLNFHSVCACIESIFRL
jgi:hypothetical protein